jgi:hypothetical protein
MQEAYRPDTAETRNFGATAVNSGREIRAARKDFVDERQSFLQDEDDDRVLFEKLQEHVLEKYLNPDRVGCISHGTLKAWVFSPRSLDLSDPKYLHVLKCAECTRELIELRKQRNKQRGQVEISGTAQKTKVAKDWRWAGVTAVLVVVLALTVAGLTYWRIHSAKVASQDAEATPIAETIDLSQAGTTRGDKTSTVPPVTLPRRVVSTHILLPYYSPGGKYVVSVTTDRNGASDRAEGQATANVSGAHTDLIVRLDLRNLVAGTYYLATTHEGDRASYYYPLTVR